jgi:hypothetical protein
LLLRLPETRLVTIVGRDNVEWSVSQPKKRFVERARFAAHSNVSERPIVPVRPLPVQDVW